MSLYLTHSPLFHGHICMYDSKESNRNRILTHLSFCHFVKEKHLVFLETLHFMLASIFFF